MKFANAENIRSFLNLGISSQATKVFTSDSRVHKVVGHREDPENPGNIIFTLDDGNQVSYLDLGYYDPRVDGAVTAVRIYNKDGYQPMADLTFAFGGTFTFAWDRCDLREMFQEGITAYTLMYDTRAVQPFTTWIRPEDDKSSWPNMEEVR